MRKLSTIDRLLEVTTLLLLMALWGYLFLVYPSLPSVIPTHFNLGGEADDFSGKKSIWVLPAIASAVYIGLTLLGRIPHKFNYPLAVTPENAERLYAATVTLLRVIKFLVVLVFSTLVYLTCASVKEGSFQLGAWFGLSVAGVFMLTVGIYLVSVTRRG